MALATNDIPSVAETTLRALASKFGVQRLALFGSVAKGEARPDSDIDVLVDFLPQTSLSIGLLVDLEEALKPLLGGRPVDLVIRKDLHWFIRDEVNATSRVIYER